MGQIRARHTGSVAPSIAYPLWAAGFALLRRLRRGNARPESEPWWDLGGGLFRLDVDGGSGHPYWMVNVAPTWRRAQIFLSFRSHAVTFRGHLVRFQSHAVNFRSHSVGSGVT